ncbi:hypothetical protein QBC37DRAFT_404479 [Rhypophila decipiens]|uniref:Uncharacterized protein n=1 Tax=Rhypophila decipiens TaxID=261697 RepID=A0AAN6XZ28_9PEZI|nr:hypothetical protein QBC37DRAFT_404479 [Rhypophila decipiens]
MVNCLFKSRPLWFEEKMMMVRPVSDDGGTMQDEVRVDSPDCGCVCTVSGEMRRIFTRTAPPLTVSCPVSTVWLMISVLGSTTPLGIGLAYDRATRKSWFYP